MDAPKKKYGKSTYAQNEAYSKKKKATPVTVVDKSLDRRVKKLESEVEWKYTDVNNAGYVVIPAESAGAPYWDIYCLNPSVLGTAQAGQRVGTQIDTKMLLVRISNQGQPLNIIDNRVRIVIFWYKNSNTLLPVATQLFDLSSLARPTYAFYNDQYKESFKVIYDETHELKPLDWNGTTTTIGDQVSINKIFKLGRKVKYILGAGAGTYADILDNSLYIAAMTSANSGAAGANNPQWFFNSRCYYVDS